MSQLLVVVSAEDPDDRYMLVGTHVCQTSVLSPLTVALVRIPKGMGQMDLGRRFRHAPVPEDFFRAEIIGSEP